jgi:hypothetical protein
VRRTKRTALLVTGLSLGVLALAGAGGAAVLTSGSHAHQSSRPTSYCAAALRALSYSGDDTGRFRSLLGPVVDLAPHELRATVVALRRAVPGSTAFDAARQRWQHSTTDTCCECIGGQHAPDVVGVKPT